MTRFLNARRALAALLAVGTALLAGCGNNDGGGSAQLRVLNLSSDVTSVDVSLNASKTFSAVSSSATNPTSYASVNTDSYTISVSNAGDPTTLYSGTFSFSKDHHYTGIVWGSSSGLRFSTLPEDQDDSLSSGNTEVRVFNATINSGAFDVYLTASGIEDLSNVTPTRSNVQPVSSTSGGLSGYATLAKGSYRLRITAAGNPNDVRLDVPSITLGDQQYATVVITSGPGNALVNATVLIQQGNTVTPFTNGQSRLRVVASVQLNSDNTRSTVSVNIDGATLSSGTQRSPSVGPYTTLSAGSHQVDVMLNGVVISSATQSFTAGGDYTLMAWGPQSGAQVVLQADDNSVPTSGRISLRLVNGDDNAGPVTLVVDNGNVLISDIAPGAFSSYVSATASSTTLPSTLEIDSQSASAFGPLYSNSNQALLSQGVYTMFLLRGGLANGQEVSTGILRKDR